MITEDFIDSVRDAYLDVRKELAREDRPPLGIAYPKREWDFLMVPVTTFTFRRPETKAAIEKLDAKFFRKPWTEKWSRKLIRRTLANAISSAIQTEDPAEVRQAFAAAITALEQTPPTHLVLFALGGIHAEEELRFGDAFRIFTMDAARVDQTAAVFQRILETTQNSDEEKVHLRAQLKRDLETLQGWTCVEVKVVGDGEKAREDAVDLAEPIMDILQVSAAISVPYAVTVTPFAVPTPRPPTLLIRSDGTEASRQFSFDHTRRANVNAGTLNRLREVGFEALLNSLEKAPNQRSTFEALLVTSMHWIADGLKQQNAENSITSYMTSIEMFFSSANGTVVRDVSEGVAYMLGQNLEHRKIIRDLIVDLYGSRSSVSHSGSRTVSDQEVFELKNLAINLLARMSQLAEQFDDRKAVREWLADLRLSGEYQDAPQALGYQGAT